LLLHEQGDTQAVEFYREAIAAGDNIAEAYCNLGIIDLDRGNMVGALDNFTQSLKHDPRHVEAHYNLANLYYDVRDFRSRDCTTKRRHKSSRTFLWFTTTLRSSITV